MENGNHIVFNSEHLPKLLDLTEEIAEYGSLEGYARQSLMEDVLTDDELATIIRRSSEATDVIIIRE